MFDVFLLRGKEEENGGLTFDPETGLYLRRAEVVQEQGARDEEARQVLEQKRSAEEKKRAAEAEERRIAEENYRKMAEKKWCTDLRRLADEKKMKEDTEEKNGSLS